ncbi:efflux RND transporter periplasmic adaptor subunit [Streptomyces sp. NPDC017979]|uniref:efflux RND transporter periplasmic adaptor subunit n=1 Tax=Streptomyces sp. NPDC017979 TaxID=3365024 RepID=UPI0037AB21E9
MAEPAGIAQDGEDAGGDGAVPHGGDGVGGGTPAAVDLTAPPGRPGAPRRKRRGRTTAAALAVLAVLGAGAVTALDLVADDGSSDGSARDERPPNTGKVTRQDLRDVETAAGELGYGTTTDVTSRLGGTVTALPKAGDRIARGKPLYAVDDAPVTLMYGSLPAYRALKSGVEGADVRQLEVNLHALGHRGFTVDDEFTEATADAVRAWQEDLGVAETGAVDLGRVVFAPGEVRVDALEAEKGGGLQPGAKVLSYTGTAKAVTVELEAEDLRLAKKGATVDVALPDDSRARGRIEEVSTVIEPATGQDQEAQTKVEVVVALQGAKAQKAADAYVMAAVDVDFVAETREDVLTVPVAALLALAEGGFGVEVVKGGASSYVPVTAGMFAQGRVEVSGPGIAEGTSVGMPE